jgi:hypothetical protein
MADGSADYVRSPAQEHHMSSSAAAASRREPVKTRAFRIIMPSAPRKLTCNSHCPAPSSISSRPISVSDRFVNGILQPLDVVVGQATKQVTQAKGGSRVFGLQVGDPTRHLFQQVEVAHDSRPTMLATAVCDRWARAAISRRLAPSWRISLMAWSRRTVISSVRRPKWATLSLAGIPAYLASIFSALVVCVVDMSRCKHTCHRPSRMFTAQTTQFDGDGSIGG